MIRQCLAASLVLVTAFPTSQVVALPVPDEPALSAAAVAPEDIWQLAAGDVVLPDLPVMRRPGHRHRVGPVRRLLQAIPEPSVLLLLAGSAAIGLMATRPPRR